MPTVKGLSKVIFELHKSHNLTLKHDLTSRTFLSGSIISLWQRTNCWFSKAPLLAVLTSRVHIVRERGSTLGCVLFLFHNSRCCYKRSDTFFVLLFCYDLFWFYCVGFLSRNSFVTLIKYWFNTIYLTQSTENNVSNYFNCDFFIYHKIRNSAIVVEIFFWVNDKSQFFHDANLKHP